VLGAVSLEDRILLDEGFFILLLAEYAVLHLRGFTELYYQKQSVPHHLAIQTILEMQHSQSYTKSVCSAIISLLASYRRYCSLADAALPL
jgi:hypothetical protein